MNEYQVRDHVRKLRRFYTDVLIYAVVNIGLILIWAVSGGGYFWPIWVIIGWGIGLGVHAFSLGLIPQMNAMVPFMTAEWEDQEVRRLMEAGYKGKEQAEKRAQEKAAKKIAQEIEKKTETIVEKIAETLPEDKPKMTKTPAIKKVRVSTAKKPKV
jgi:hypothetical protein